MNELLKFFMIRDTLIFTRVMGLFWLFAEAFCLVFVRWGYYDLIPVKTMRGQKPFILVLLSGFLFLIFLTFSQDLILMKVFPGSVASSRSLRSYYYSSLWRLFCTLWVLIEGAITIYVIRIEGLFIRMKIPSKNRIDPLMVSFITVFLFFYIFYEVSFVRVVLNGGMGWKAVMNISRFYIKICGFFWILFEWIVALLGWRIYRFLKKGGVGYGDV